MKPKMPGGAIGWFFVVVLSVVAVLLLQWSIARRMSGNAQNHPLLQSGRPAAALVLDTYDTGNRVTAIYILTRLRLRVEAVDAAAPFETEITVPISPVKLAEFAPGRTVRVRVDAATREVVIDQARR